MTKEEKKDLAQDALRFLEEMLPPERYGEDARCEVIERALTQLKSDAEEEEFDFHDMDDDPYIKGSYWLLFCWWYAGDWPCGHCLGNDYNGESMLSLLP